MKVVIAPDSFKESLPAAEAAVAIAQGVLRVCSDARIDICPMADGGEGTVAAMVAATGGEFASADVFGPLGAQARAKFGLLGESSDSSGLPGELGFSAAMGRADGEGASDRRVAVVEMAAASGLALVAPDLRDPLRTTTFGTGQLILAALDAGAREIIVGVGGSATVDGGAGCAQALGATFLDSAGELLVCGLAGGGLDDISTIDLSDLDPRLSETTIRIAADVTNPLVGPQGAASVYGPQKGATPETVIILERNLQHFAAVVENELGVEIASVPGAGAAGGLAAGLVAFAGGEIEPGAKLVAEKVGLSRRLKGADLAITGEGRLDASSASGKTPFGVLEEARMRDVPVICIAGQVAGDAPVGEFAAVQPLVTARTSEKTARLHTAELLAEAAAQAVQKFLVRRP